MHSSGKRNNLQINPLRGFPVRVQTSTRRRKTITIKIQETEIVVQAPHTASKREIEQALAKHNNWILSVLEERQSRQHSPKTTADEDAWRHHLLYQGIPLMLRYQKQDSLGTVQIEFQQHTLLVDAPPLSNAELRSYVVKWFRMQAKEYIPKSVAAWAERLGASYGSIRIKDVSSRWGSCSSKGNLNFNWRLICAPEFVQDYVIVHELCHLWELNHSNRFWDRVRHALPSYKESQSWLRAHGKSLYF